MALSLFIIHLYFIYYLLNDNKDALVEQTSGSTTPQNFASEKLFSLLAPNL